MTRTYMLQMSVKGGDEKSGCYKEFKSFIKSKDKDEEYDGNVDRSNLFVPFRGNRFNIIFYNGEVVYYLANYVEEFFTFVYPPTNTLQKAVFYDIKENFLLSTCKALGLCSKLVTAPFWRIMEKNLPIQEVSVYYQTIASFFFI